MVVLLVMALGLVYLGHSVLALQERVNELEWTIVDVGVTIDNGTALKEGTVHLTRGATALDALRRVAIVETQYYPGLGEFITSIDGLSQDPETSQYWMFYVWNENGWVLAPVGAGSYQLEDGDNIKFSYEVVSW